jgi:hypothetical protein
MKKTALLLAGIMTTILCITVMPVQASVSIPAIFPVVDGYTYLQSGGSNWYDNENLYLDGRTGTERITFLKFEVPEFEGSVESATLRLRTKESVANVAEGDQLMVYRVIDNSWDSDSKMPTYSDGTYTPYINPAPMAVHVFTADGFSAGKNIDIDIKNIIKQPGIYSLAVHTTANAYFKFFAQEDPTYGNVHGARIVNLTYNPDLPREDVSTVLDAPNIPAADDGYYVNEGEKGWVNGETLHNRTSSSGLPARVSYFRFTVPEYIKNVKQTRLNLTVANVPDAGEYEISAWGVEDTAWAEESGSLPTPSGTDNPEIFPLALDSVVLNNPAKDQTISLDLSGLVRRPGTYAVAIKNSSQSRLDFYAKDHTAAPKASKPNLKIRFDIDAPEGAGGLYVRDFKLTSDFQGKDALVSLDDLSEGESFYAAVSLSNDGTEGRRVAFVVAQYTEGRQDKVDISYIDIQGGWYGGVTREAAYKQGVTRVRIFVCDIDSGLLPCVDFKEVKLSTTVDPPLPDTIGSIIPASIAEGSALTEVYNDGSRYLFKGRLPDGPYKNALLIILKDRYSEGIEAGDVIYVNQCKTDANGAFSFDMVMPDGSDDTVFYDTYIYAGGESFERLLGSYDLHIRYVKTGARDELRQEINKHPGIKGVICFGISGVYQYYFGKPGVLRSRGVYGGF